VESGRVGLHYKEYYGQKGLARPYDATVKMLMKIIKIIGACAPLRRDRSRLRSLTSGRQINNFI